MNPPQEPSVAAPKISTRLLWWFGIYFAAQLPLIKDLGGIFLFPWGLFGVFLLGRSSNNPDLIFLAYFGYGFYFIHFLLTLVLPGQRTFRVLMIILIVAVILNLAGCEGMLNGLKGIH